MGGIIFSELATSIWSWGGSVLLELVQMGLFQMGAVQMGVVQVQMGLSKFFIKDYIVVENVEDHLVQLGVSSNKG